MGEPVRVTTLLAELRRLDPERAPLAVFAAPALRAPFAAALLVHAELARACEEAGEDMVALVRLAWWREALEAGRGEGHPALALLADAVRGEPVRRALLATLPAREALVEARGFPTVAAYLDHARATAGRLHALLAELAGRPPALREAAFRAGAAYGAAGLLRSSRAYARRGIALVPRELLPARRTLARAGGIAVPELAEAVRRLLEAAAEAFPLPADPDPLVRLPARLARRSRRQLARAGFDPFHRRVGPLVGGGLDLRLLLAGIRPGPGDP